MQWTDNGIILGSRNLGENKVILTILTQQNGKQSGALRVNKSNKAYIQPGNKVALTWSSRLPEQLGSWTVEPISINCGLIMTDQAKLCALLSSCAILSYCLADREEHNNLYCEFEIYIKNLISNHNWIKHHIFFELSILRDLGYGLDFTQCAATGVTEDLAYVSPKTGRAVCQSAGAIYKDRLLKLPQFMINAQLESGDVIDGLKLTRYFIEKNLLSHANKPVPNERSRLEKFLFS